MTSVHRVGSCGAILGVFFLVACAQVVDKKIADRDDLKDKFQKSMQGVALEGHFMLKGKEGIYPEYYEIDKVSNISGDNYWLIHARIKYGDHDVRVPVPVRILWADDTPIVTLTDVTIPGLGTFTARVLFHDGQYVGTWSSGDHSGQQFGRIVKR
jgi:hypothetical protein